MFSAQWISTQSTTTRPNVTENAHDGAGGHVRLVLGFATKAIGSESRRTGPEIRVARISGGRPRSDCRPCPSGVALRNTGGRNLRRLRDALRAFDEPHLRVQDYE